MQMTAWVLTREQPHQQMMAFVLKLLGRSNKRMGTKSFSYKGISRKHWVKRDLVTKWLNTSKAK